MNQENSNAEMYDIRQILEEISKYEVSRDGIIDFLLQDKKDDIAFLYYKNMLLQLGQFDENLCPIIGYYDSVFFDKQDISLVEEVLNNVFRTLGNNGETKKYLILLKQWKNSKKFPM